MKLIFLLLFFVVLSVVSIAGQRRSSNVEITQQETTNPRLLSRGRARFSQTTESIEAPQEYEWTRLRTNRNQQQRSKIAENRNSRTATTTTSTTTIEPDYVAKGYEVKESIEDTPPDFSPNKVNLLPTEGIINDNSRPSQELSPQFSATTSTSTTTTTTTQRIAEEIPEIQKELPQVEPTSLRNDDRILKTSRISDRRNPLRSQKVAESATVASRRRSRNRNVNEIPSTTTTASITRPTRRNFRGRITESTTRTPINPEITSTETLRRSRTGRKVVSNVPTTSETTPQRNRSNNRRSGSGGQILVKNNEIQPRSNINQNVKVDDTRRLRSRQRHLPPILNENQLEVLPLFEREEESSKSSSNKATNPALNSVETVTKTTRTKQRPNSRQIIVKQSVISEVNEVTSRRTVTRIPRRRLESSTVGSNKNANDKRRKTVSEDKVKENLTNSGEEIDESDNYPEPFKTLIQTRKTGKEPKVSTIRKSTARAVQSTTTTTTTPTPTKSPTKKLSLPKRFPSTARPVKEKTTTTTTTTATTTTTTTRKPERFHAKTNNLSYQKPEISTVPPKFPRTQPTKHARKLYSSKKRDEYEKRAPHSTQVPPSTFARSNRYSSRYRKNILSNGKRVGNTPPVYQPTVPTVRTTPAAKSLVEDKDLGLEVVTINDPIYTPPSANLVNANYTNRESDNRILVAEAQTKPAEKPKSLIEQIISSITAISTTPSPPTATSLNLDNNVILTTDSIAIETTRPTTILRLTTKKTDKIDDRRTTTERPTTVIEKILNSLSAIQLEATTENNDIKSSIQTTTTISTTTEDQVGTDLNTISPSIFPTPIGESLINNAPSTIVNNLDVLDSISADEILQKNTIDSLLELLKSLSSTTTTTTTTTTETITTTAATATSTGQEMSTTEMLTSTTIRPQLESRFGIDDSELTTQLSTTLSNEIVPEITTTTTTTETNTQTPTTYLTTTDPPTTIVPENTNNNNPTVVPPLIRFEVSPGSVSVFSVNDLSNSITSDDNSITTVTIPNRSNSQFSGTSTSVFSSTTSLPETTTTIPLQSDSSDALTTESSTSSYLSTTVSEMFSTVEQGSSVTTEVDPPTSEISSIVETSTSIAEVAPFTSEINSATLAPTTSSTLESGTFTTVLPTSTLNASDSLSVTTTENISQSLVNPLLNEISTSNASVNSQSNQGGFLNNNNSSQIGIKNRASSQSITELINNSIDTSTPSTVSPNKDYFIFAILNNNTILRKRPSEFPNEMTPYLVVGVYPNNTIVRKFPNGTLVPMEPVIRVSGFDTRANPPTLTEITSNQVTPDQGSEQDNTNLQMNEPTTVPPIEANALSVNDTSTDSNSPPPTTSTTLTTLNNDTEVTTQQNNGNDSIAILPTLNEILNGKTVKAFNSIINISDLSGRAGNSQNRTTTTTTSSTIPASTTEEALPITQIFTSAITTPLPLSTTIDPVIATTLEIITTTIPSTTTTSTSAPTTTTTTTTTPASTTTITTSLPSTTSKPTTTTSSTTTTVTSLPSTTTIATTTEPTTTFIPTTTTTSITTPAIPTTTFAVTTTTDPPTTTTAATTTTTVPAKTTAVPTRIVSARANALVIEDNEISSTRSNSVVVQADAQVFTSPALSSTKSPKQLTKQQLEDLQTLAKLESEQAAILKQLAFLNNLNLVNQPITTQSPTELANKIIALAIERSNRKDQSTTISSVDSQKAAVGNGRVDLEKLLSTIPKTTNIQSSFGKSNDAIIAELLKNEGIAPTTPNGLAVIYTKTTIAPTTPSSTTKRTPTTTTKKPAQPRAPVLMQGLRWLLNAFNGPPTTTQKPKPKTQPKPKSTDKETLINQPTRITPVVVTSPKPLPLSNSVSQTDVEFLIKKLEEIQRDPKNTKLDLETQEKLQNLITGGGFNGATSLPSSTTTTTTTTASTTKARREKQISTTKIPIVEPLPSTTTQRVVDELVSVSPTTSSTTKPKTTTRTRISLPPVQLSSVPGVGDDETLVRGQLISAAINVTRALTQFLGSALQGAAYNFQNLLGSGSRYIGTFARGSSTNSSNSLS